MDDSTFDQKSAADWINIIESPGSNIRDNDIYPKLNSWINEVSPNTILDLGCGQGVCSEKITLDKLQYYGVEPSPFLLQRAQALYGDKKKTFLAGNAYEIPFASSTLEAVFSIAVWHLLHDIQMAAHELHRVLIEGGHFLIITAHPEHYQAWTSSYSNPQISGNRFTGTIRHEDGSETTDILHLHRFEELRASLENSDLVVLKTESFRNFLLIQGRKLQRKAAVT